MKLLRRLLFCLIVIALVAGTAFYRDPLWLSDQQIRLHLWRSNVRGHYLVTSAGYKLHYFEATPPDGSAGIPLVLVHGLGSRGEDWSPMIPTLAAQGFHVYAPDLLGYGRSAKPDVAYNIPLEEQSLLGFLQAAQIHRADIVGWSMGGWVAARTALDHPDQVDRLVLYDSAGLQFAPSFPRTIFVPTNPAELGQLLDLLTPHPPTVPGFVTRAILRRIHGSAPIIQSTVDAMERGDDLLDGRLNGIRQPTLIAWGAEDKLLPITLGETMHALIPGSVFLRVQGCGHLAPAECPRPILEETVRFLKTDPAMRGGESTVQGRPDR